MKFCSTSTPTDVHPGSSEEACIVAIPPSSSKGLAAKPSPGNSTATAAKPCDDDLVKKTLKDWHPDEQPRERLMKHGAGALATSELIAILLRSGTQRHSAMDVARDLLQRSDGQLRGLSRLDYKTLAEAHGIGQVKAVTLVAALELGFRRSVEKDVDRPIVLTAAAAFNCLGPRLCDLPHEECWVLMTNAAGRYLGQECLSRGGVDGTVVDVRSVMATALRFNASGIVIAHNHPSGNLTPSSADISITKNLVQAGVVMNIPLHDHLIVAGKRFYSFKESGQL